MKSILVAIAAALTLNGCALRTTPPPPPEPGVHHIEGHPSDVPAFVPKTHSRDIFDDYDIHLDRMRWRTHTREVGRG